MAFVRVLFLNFAVHRYFYEKCNLLFPSLISLSINVMNFQDFQQRWFPVNDNPTQKRHSLHAYKFLSIPFFSPYALPCGNGLWTATSGNGMKKLERYDRRTWFIRAREEKVVKLMNGMDIWRRMVKFSCHKSLIWMPNTVKRAGEATLLLRGDIIKKF